MRTTRLGLSATPQAEIVSFAGKYSTQITQFGLMGVTMKRYGSFASKPAPSSGFRKRRLIILGTR